MTQCPLELFLQRPLANRWQWRLFPCTKQKARVFNPSRYVVEHSITISTVDNHLSLTATTDDVAVAESFQEQQLPPPKQEATTNSVRNLFYLLFLGGNVALIINLCCARHIPLYYACDRGTIVLRALLTMTRTNILVKQLCSCTIKQSSKMVW